MCDSLSHDERIALLDYTPVPALIADGNGAVAFMNKAAVQLIGPLRNIEELELDLAAIGDLSKNQQSMTQIIQTRRGYLSVELHAIEMPAEAKFIIQIVNIDQYVQQIRELTAQLDTDPLTDVASRRRVMSEGDRLLADRKRHGHDLAIAIVDLDRFKSVNDRCGHVIGDLVLAAVASAMGRSLRRNDIIGRLGGDEFVILMPNTQLSQAQTTIGRMAEWVEQELLASPPARVLPSLSIGIAAAREDDRDFQALLDRADKALYRAKESGESRIAFIG